MINSIELDHFKGFESFKINDMKQITLFGGMNNTGKTALLEAIFLTTGISIPGIFHALYFSRNINIGQNIPKFTPDRLWNPLFYNLKDSRSCESKIVFDDGKFCKVSLEKVRDVNAGLNVNADTVTSLLKRGTSTTEFDAVLFALKFNSETAKGKVEGIYSIENGQIKYIAGGPMPDVSELTKVVYYHNISSLNMQDLAEIVSNIISQDRKDILINILKYFEEDITDVYVTVEDGIAGINVRLSTGLVLPISYMGDGINKGLHLFSLVFSSTNSIILIDEIENGLHYTSYHPLLKILFEIAIKNNNQLIITTHSEEAIGQSVHIMESFGMLDKMSYQRLDRRRTIKVTAYTGQQLLDSIEYNMEVR